MPRSQARPVSATSCPDRLLQPLSIQGRVGRNNPFLPVENSLRAPGASTSIVKIISPSPVRWFLIEEREMKALFRQKFLAKLHAGLVYSTLHLLPLRERSIIVHHLE